MALRSINIEAVKIPRHTRCGMKRPEGAPTGKPRKTGRTIAKMGIVNTRFCGCDSKSLWRSPTLIAMIRNNEKKIHSRMTSLKTDMEGPRNHLEVSGHSICTPSPPPVNSRSPISVCDELDAK